MSPFVCVGADDFRHFLGIPLPPGQTNRPSACHVKVSSLPARLMVLPATTLGLFPPKYLVTSQPPRHDSDAWPNFVLSSHLFQQDLAATIQATLSAHDGTR